MTIMNPKAAKHTIFIKDKARELGFSFCGVSEAGFLEEEAPRLEAWLSKGYHGSMGYMENHFDKRLDPRKLVEGAKSVVSLGFNYYPEKDLAQEGEYKIAKYAYGIDYHFVVKDRMRQLMQAIREEIGEVGGRAFVDSAPVMEHAWARKSGLGWVGKHSLLLNRQMGSFFFLSELILDLELVPDSPVPDYCGTCTRCIDACPTDAIADARNVDGSKCISYLTIELKDGIPAEFKEKMQEWIFGCDICQDVCPWNRFSKPNQVPEFQPHKHKAQMKKRDWEEITREVFNEIFRKSAVKRTKLEGLQRNIRFVQKD